jgi:ferredoxin
MIGGKEKKGWYTVLVEDDEYEANLIASKHCPVNIIKIEKL